MEIGLKNQSPEKMLEKSVAILADQQHMRDWFNQCPVATGIADPYADGGRRIDLVQLSGRAVRLVELKWNSDTPVYALFEVLEYGLAYLLARIRRRDFGLSTQPLMLDRVDQVRLEVVGPQAFFHNRVRHQLEFFPSMDKALASFAAAQSDGALSMSLRALSFPAWFDRVPFASGQEVKEKCANPCVDLRRAQDSRRVRPPRAGSVCTPMTRSEFIEPDCFCAMRWLRGAVRHYVNSVAWGSTF